jgi:hypothetical protein
MIIDGAEADQTRRHTADSGTVNLGEAGFRREI